MSITVLEDRRGKRTLFFDGASIAANGSSNSDIIAIMSHYEDHQIDGNWNGSGILKLSYKLFYASTIVESGPRIESTIFEGSRSLIELPRPLVLLPGFNLKFTARETGGSAGIRGLTLYLIESGGAPPTGMFTG